MRAIVTTALGSLEVLKEKDVNKPQPGPRDLLIEVHGSSLNPVDTKMRKHGLGGLCQPPFILGFDVSGVVVDMGERVSGFQIGDHVYGYLSLFRNGAHAEYVAADYRMCAHKPVKLSHIEAATLPLVTVTAWEAVYDRLNVTAGGTILIHAGGGGVGHIALQLAKLRGCRVITTASSANSIDLCKKLGADLVINYREEDFVDRINKRTGNKGVPYIFDCVGGTVFDQSLDCLAPCGAIATIVEGQSAEIHKKLFFKNASCHFVFIGAQIFNEIMPEKQGQILSRAACLVDEGSLRPNVYKVLALKDLPEGHTLQESGKVTGKLAVKIRD